MANLNKVMLIGNLTADPEVKYTPKGTAIANFTLAINRTWKTDTGEKREEVTFVGCSAFGRVAEIIGEWCKKGKPAFVEGRLTQETWDDKQTGEKKSKTKVSVESMQLLGGKSDAPAQQSAPERKPAPAPAKPRPPVDPDLDVEPDQIPF